MANLNSFFHAQRLSAGDIRRLAYAIYGLDILGEFVTIGQYRDLVHRKPLTGRAKAIDFPITSSLTPFYQTPGVQILGDNFPIEKVSITPDQLAVIAISFPWGEQQIGDYLFAPKGSSNYEIAKAMAEGFGKMDDMQISVLLARAARGHYERASNEPVSRKSYGSSGYGNANRATINAQTAVGASHLNSYDPGLKLDFPVSAQDFMDRLSYIRTLIIKRDLPRENWYCVVQPEIYTLLWNDLRFRGDIESGFIGAYGGFKIRTMSRIPSLSYIGLDQTPAANAPLVYDSTPPYHAGADLNRNKYFMENPQVTAALVFHTQDSIARLDVLNIVHEAQWHQMYQSTLSTTTAMFGGGTKRGELVFEICYSRPPVNSETLTADPNNYIPGYNDAP
jgi:hypothetical protein